MVNHTDHLNAKMLETLAGQYGSSFYLLNSERFRQNYLELTNAFRAIYPRFGIAYSYKTNYIPALCKLVDELGGVEIDIAERELNQLNKLIAEYNASWGFSGGTFSRSGLQRLDGRQALCYSRIRKIDSDFQRSSRQQALLTAMFREAAQLPAWQLLKLAVRHLSRIQTDLSLSDLLALLPMASRLSETAIHTACVPFEGTYRDETISGSQVLVPDLERCREKLSAFLP